MNALLQDIKYAFRMLLKAPGFTAAAVLSLALGIGANSAIFTVINTLLLNPLPVHDPQRLVNIFTTDTRNQGVGFIAGALPVSYPNATDIAARAQSFSGVMIQGFTGVSMTINGEPQRLFAIVTSGNYFDVLGVKPELGRAFRPEEDAQPGAGPVVVLSHGIWVRRFSADRNVIGKEVLLNGQGFTIIGVAPKGFQGTFLLGGPDMWIPMSMRQQVFSGFYKKNLDERRFLGFAVTARLKPGVAVQAASAELDAIGKTLEHDFPVPNKGRSFAPVLLPESTVNPGLRDALIRGGGLMMTVVGLVLLIACANIANLLLARATSRRREISIRLALGAKRSRIVAQLMTESILLAVAGGLLGLGIAVLARDALWKFRPPFLAQLELDLAFDPKVLMFTVGVSLLTGILFGLAPALQATRPDLVLELKERTGETVGGAKRFSLRSVLVIFEFALSLVALVGAGLFLISLRNAQRMDPGFDATNLAMVTFDLGSLNYGPPQMREFQRRALEATQAAPGVKSATLASNVPLFAGGGFARSVFPEGADTDQRRSGIVTAIDPVAGSYFTTLGIPLLRGRDFSDSIEREDSPKVAIMNETAAKRFFPNDDPIGRRFKFFGEKEFVQVIGIARDSKYNTLGEPPTEYIYLPLVQNPTPAMNLIVKTATDPQSVLTTLRTQVQALDRNLPLTNIQAFGAVISQNLWAAKFSAGLLSLFAALAVTLAVIGIYGVVSYSVGQRVREIGIRMALGAHPGDVLKLILRQSALMLMLGVVAGLAAAFGLTRLIASLLYGVKATDVAPAFLLALALAAIGLAASYFPARRATKVDPMVALRYE
jgi:putative ABC transport system permease protein